MKQLLVTFFIYSISFSQVAIGNIDPHNHAQLDVSATQKGILIPRIALHSESSPQPISSDPSTLPISLLVFNLNDTVPDLDKAYYYWQGMKWIKITSQEDVKTIFTFGDVKQGFQTTDHKGWIKLDARAISTLTPTQRVQAHALGFTSHLPDATDKVLKQKETLNTTGGSNTVTITKENIPDYYLPTATTSINGAHTHTYDKSDSCAKCLTYVEIFWKTSLNREYHSENTSSSGNHNHTVTVHSGGSGTALKVENQYLSVNTFVYLGN